MLIIEHTVLTSASTDKIWALWQDVNNWAKWDHEIEYAKLDGNFKVGAKCKLKPKNMREVSFIIIDVKEKKRFSDISNLPLAQLIFTHTLNEVEAGKTSFTHRVDFEGPLSWLWALIIGGSMKKGVPQAMQNLAKLAEQT